MMNLAGVREWVGAGKHFEKYLFDHYSKLRKDHHEMKGYIGNSGASQ